MVDIEALRARLTKGESAAALATEIMDEPEIKAAYLDYECKKLAQGATRVEIEGLLDRLEHWRKEVMR